MLVLLMLALIAVQNWRQARAGRQWADTERRFRVAVEAARCGVWEWDLVRGEVVLSDYMAALLEVEPGQVLTTQALIERVHPAIARPWSRPWTRPWRTAPSTSPSPSR